MDVQPINIEIDWRYVAGVLLVLGLAIIGFLRDRTNVVYRVGALEAKLHDREELLNEKFHSDVDNLIPIAASMQAAARAQGKELRVKDIAVYLREKRRRKEREAAKGANNQ